MNATRDPLATEYDTVPTPAMHPRPTMLTRTLLTGLIVAALTTAGAAPDSAPPAKIPPPVQPPRLGFTLNCHHIGDLDRYLRAVDRIAALGANALLIVTPMFQEKVDSTSIAFPADRCPTDAQLRAILERACAKRLHTTLVPIVLIDRPGADDWRGTLRPADWNQWWESYSKAMDRFVALAVDSSVDVLSVGSELNSTEHQLERWRMLIENTRRRHTGRLTYSANWDHYEHVTFWSLLDEIGISAYFEVGRPMPPAELAPADAVTPDSATMTAAWAGPRDALLTFATRIGKPLVLTEIGYPSVTWAGVYPWNYVAPPGTNADAEAQARCYDALFSAWHDALADDDGPLRGMQLYHWDPYHSGGTRDTGYGVDGKPSMAIIQAAFERLSKHAPATAK